MYYNNHFLSNQKDVNSEKSANTFDKDEIKDQIEEEEIKEETK